ncbi:MAG: epimerase [Edaphobacter sp.]|uniref:NAD-dependent epimerase/dehydratase family protein n=1 Tax=Edaphobacter sp. TaxID=1934404 RepID=UPI00239523C3|nr:NAD-dependent epimerase/dehydratase family protein [Edaphobacter sp.]MDE1178785.1 epimerase [Edaphobacter sp.]
MSGISVIVTGSTGMVGEGVLLECLQNPAVERVLMVNRKPSPIRHAKLTELIAPDFLTLAPAEELRGYDACFFCAGVSSLGKDEAAYTRITYDTTLHFAEVLHGLNPRMTFCYVTGAHTDSTEQGKTMWARVKGRTENALTRVGFTQAYNFRPGMMEPSSGQKNVPGLYRALLVFYPLIAALAPRLTCTIRQVGQAMIHSVQRGYPKTTLEIPDIKALAQG